MYYIKLLLCSLILFTSLGQAQSNPDFFVENGTCKCPDADFGDTGTLTINAEQKTFTKRTRNELDGLITNNEQDPEIALTCTSGIVNMDGLFSGKDFFNQNINHWDVSNVTSMEFMFNGASDFDQPLDNWDVSNAKNMRLMFAGASVFNQPLNDWEVFNVESMFEMFESANQFNQDLSNWIFNSEVDLDHFISYSGISQNNYELLLQSFNDQNLTDKFFTANLIGYCNDLDRNELISQKNWYISGDVKAQCDEPNFQPSTSAFVTTWTVTSGDPTVDIFTSVFYEYDYSVDWGDGSMQSNLTSDVSHTYQSSGTYTVSITGVFPHFNVCKRSNIACENALKLNTIDAWGNQKWRNMHSSFRNANNMYLVANDIPDLSNVKQMNYMLSECQWVFSTINDWNVTNVTEMSSLFDGLTSFNKPLDSWDVSNVEYMKRMFAGCDNFNQPLSAWDVSNAIDMTRMFVGCGNFNQPLDNWNTSSVINMSFMFGLAYNFNQPLNNWDTSSVIYMTYMFGFCGNFNQPLNNWDVSNVTDMRFMFALSVSFNQSLNNWDVSNVIDMNAMFSSSRDFNQPLNTWDVSNVKNMRFMFTDAEAFNQPLNSWDVSNVINMDSMFLLAESFNQDLTMWCVEQIPGEPIDFSVDSPLLDINKPNWGVDCNLSMDDFTLSNVVVYPNPASDYFYISSANQNAIENLQLIDTSGKKYTVNDSENSNRFDISAIASGIYFVQISYADGSSVVRKLIIK